MSEGSATIDTSPVIARAGSTARIVVGTTLVVLAIVEFDVGWRDTLLGLVGLPALATAAMLALRRPGAPGLRLGAAGHVVTLAHITLVLVVAPDAALLFYGSTALVAGIHGNRGCEITAISNWIRHRDDQIGCPLFAPIDALEPRHRTGKAR